MNTVSKKIGKVVANLALNVIKANANSTCVYIGHQPKAPKDLQKFRKF